MSITLYEHKDFRGRELHLTESNPDFRQARFNDITSSVRVASGIWILYKDVNYKGKSFQVTKGEYNMGTLKDNIGNDVISSARKIPYGLTLYEHADFRGRELTLTDSSPDLRQLNFNDIASSVRCTYGMWTLYKDTNYKGKSFTVTRGEYNIGALRDNIGNDVISSVKKTQLGITLYEHSDYKGRELTLVDSAADLRQFHFNDITSSVRVTQGTWTLYKDVNFKGRSFTIPVGEYNIGILRERIGNDVISSVKKFVPGITLYEHSDYKGKELTLTDSAPDLRQLRFNDITSSIRVTHGAWILYKDVNFQGKSVQITVGDYNIAALRGSIGNDTLSSVKKMPLGIILYEHKEYKGRELPLTDSAPDLRHFHFNDITSSIRVTHGTWTLYKDVNYRGRAYQVTKGDYDIGLIRDNIGNDVISSVRKH